MTLSVQRFITWNEGLKWSGNNVLWVVNEKGHAEKLFAGSWELIRTSGGTGIIGIEEKKRIPGHVPIKYHRDEIFLTQIQAHRSMEEGSRIKENYS